MYLSAYQFDGDQDTLHEGYDRLVAAAPSGQLVVNLCVDRPGGITVFDSCPSRADFESWSTGEEFQAMLTKVGLPTPRVEPLGEVYLATGSLLAAAS